MKAPGVIRIFAGKVAYPEYPPPVLTVETEDGKFMKEVAPAPSKEGWSYVIPFTEDNINLAKGFWLRRGCKVEVEAKLPEHPFNQEDYDKWFEKDNKEFVEQAKKLKKLEADLEKEQAVFETAKAEYQKQEAAFLILQDQARTSHRAAPEEPAEFKKAVEKVSKSSDRLMSLEAEIRKVKGL